MLILSVYFFANNRFFSLSMIWLLDRYRIPDVASIGPEWSCALQLAFVNLVELANIINPTYQRDELDFILNISI